MNWIFFWNLYITQKASDSWIDNDCVSMCMRVVVWSSGGERERCEVCVLYVFGVVYVVFSSSNFSKFNSQSQNQIFKQFGFWAFSYSSLGHCKHLFVRALYLCIGQCSQFRNNFQRDFIDRMFMYNRTLISLSSNWIWVLVSIFFHSINRSLRWVRVQHSVCICTLYAVRPSNRLVCGSFFSLSDSLHLPNHINNTHHNWKLLLWLMMRFDRVRSFFFLCVFVGINELWLLLREYDLKNGKRIQNEKGFVCKFLRSVRCYLDNQ